MGPPCDTKKGSVPLFRNRNRPHLSSLHARNFPKSKPRAAAWSRTSSAARSPASPCARPDLRWPIPPDIAERLPGEPIRGIRRRAKYLLLDTDPGSALLHLGMSGSLRVLPARTPVEAHDHVDLALDNGKVLRFNDPRRFGCLLWQPAGETHELLQGLGPSRCRTASTATTCTSSAAAASAPVKTFLMDQGVVVGVGNIYAAEACSRRHRPDARGRRGLARALLGTGRGGAAHPAYAIERGGTTLRDFIDPNGTPGYFEQELQVYGREGEPCRRCRPAAAQCPWATAPASGAALPALSPLRQLPAAALGHPARRVIVSASPAQTGPGER
jgi:formamidopyrimidine-DNA glycosylase